MFRFYWFTLFLLTAIASHAAYVLFVPGRTFDDKLVQTVGPDSSNRFLILSSDQAQQLVPASGPSDIVGLCRFDLSKGPVVLQTTPPKGFWTLSVYTETGTQAYALTQSQVGDSFAVELTENPDIIKKFLSAVDATQAEQEAISNEGWRISVSDKKGLAVVWVPLADHVFRTAAEARLKTSRCGPKSAQVSGG
ncbi:MAG: hypothetical protein LCH46_09420 [Proteobacteria bacterium]|nr:hypothetical protein [Pseudomonadota bacterium]